MLHVCPSDPYLVTVNITETVKQVNKWLLFFTKGIIMEA